MMLKVRTQFYHSYIIAFVECNGLLLDGPGLFTIELNDRVYTIKARNEEEAEYWVAVSHSSEMLNITFLNLFFSNILSRPWFGDKKVVWLLKRIQVRHLP